MFELCYFTIKYFNFDVERPYHYKFLRITNLPWTPDSLKTTKHWRPCYKKNNEAVDRVLVVSYM